MIVKSRASARVAFFDHVGELGCRIRELDWAASELGPPASWPAPLRTLVDVMLAAHQPMFVAWGSGRILLYNDAYVPLLGDKHPWALGRPFLHVWSEVREQLTPLVERVFAGEPVHMADLSLMLHRHGAPEEAHFAFSYTPVRAEGGEVAGLFCACNETTAAVLSQSRGNFRFALEERLRDLADPRAVMTAAAEMLEQRLGVTRVRYAELAADDVHIEIVGRGEGFGPGARHILAEFGLALATEYRAGRTVAIADTRADPRIAGQAAGRRYAALGIRALLAVPLVKSGRLAALLFANYVSPRQWSAEDAMMVRDVAERTWSAVQRARAEESLRSLAASLERQVEERTAERDRVWRNSRDLLVVVGADGVFRAVSPAWTATLGHAPEEVVGHSFLDFVYSDDAEQTGIALENAASKRDLNAFENRYRRKDGGLRWISWNTSMEGDLVYAYGRDVTDERQQAEALRHAEEALRQSQKMEAVGQLTGGLAHDFNNLLAGISGSLELLQARVAQGRVQELDRYLTAATGAVRRAAALTHRLLAFTRRQTLDPKLTDLNRLVAGMEELVRRTVGPAIAIEVITAPELWTTLVDPPQLENALLNLCINARDAMPEGGSLTIETRNDQLDRSAALERDLLPGEYVSLCVSDTGTGMTQEVIRRAFDPFFTTKPIGMGTGLGLSMIYGFVRQSGGQARICSEPGQGTAVCLHLPRHRGASQTEETVEPTIIAQAGRMATVLVVDDEPTVRMLVTEMVSDMGYAVLEAADGPAGLLQLATDQPVDLLITDVGLPGGMNGRQLADAALVRRPGLRVLFITGYAESEVLGQERLTAGMQVMTKPFALQALAARIRALVEGEPAPLP